MGLLNRIWQNMKTRKYEVCDLKGCSRTNMVYDSDTKVIYYWGEYGMAPYISENGKLCRFIDNEIVEID